MKYFPKSLLIFCTLLSLSTKAQQDHFIYFESGNKQQFYVKVDSSIFTSSPLGFIIVPKLQEKLYTVIIGFPPTTTEVEFNCSLGSKDLGFRIIQKGAKEWELHNLQTKNALKPGGVIEKHTSAVNAQQEVNTDPFSVLLSNVVHDSTILFKDVVKVVPQKPAVEEIKDTVGKTVTETDVAVITPQAAKQKMKTKSKGPVVGSTSLAKANVEENFPRVQDSTLTPEGMKSGILQNTDTVAVQSSVGKEVYPQQKPKDSIAAYEVVVSDLPIKNNPSENKDSVVVSSDSPLSAKDKRKKRKAESEVVLPDVADKEPVFISDDVALTTKEKRKKRKLESDTTAVQKEIAVIAPNEPDFIAEGKVSLSRKEQRQQRRNAKNTIDSAAVQMDNATGINSEKSTPEAQDTGNLHSEDAALTRKEKRKKRKLESDTTALQKDIAVITPGEPDFIPEDNVTSSKKEERRQRKNAKNAIDSAALQMVVETGNNSEKLTLDIKDTVNLNSEEVVLSRKERRKNKKAIQNDAAAKQNIAVNEIKDPGFNDIAIKEDKKKKKIVLLADSINMLQDEPVSNFLSSSIKRKSKKNSNKGLELVYIDKMGEETDTINILIPAEQIKILSQDLKEVSTGANNSVGKQTEPAEIIEDKNSSSQGKKKSVASVAMINSDCKKLATEEDFLKLRKKMAAEMDNESMISVARKIFKSRCFTTGQIQNLGVLFLTDEGKYLFFDAAYPFVSDSDVFSTLENQFSEEYYINRFRAMIRK